MNTRTPEGKHLKDRIRAKYATIRWKHRSFNRNKRAEPPEVRAARKVIRRYENSQQKISEQYDQRVNRALQAAEEAVMFEEPKEALAAVKRFEKMKFD